MRRIASKYKMDWHNLRKIDNIQIWKLKIIAEKSNSISTVARFGRKLANVNDKHITNTLRSRLEGRFNAFAENQV